MAEKKPATQQPEIYTGQAAPGPDGKCVLWMRTPGGEWKPHRYQVDTIEATIFRLAEIPDGRILGAGMEYGGEFIFNPAANKFEYLGKTFGNPYTFCVQDGNVYMSGYPSGMTSVYDPRRPWASIVGPPPGMPTLADDDPKRNPRLIGHLAAESGCHKMYASVAGTDGCVYFGGRWIRNGSGGGLAWFDPKTQKRGGFHDIFSNYQVRHMAAVDDARKIVISTRVTDDVVLGKERPKCGRLFVLDTATKQIVKTIDPFPDCDCPGVIVGVGGSDILGLTYPRDDKKKTILYRLNVSTGEMVFMRSLDVQTMLDFTGNETEPFDFRMGPDRKVWTILNSTTLVKVSPDTGSR